MTTATKIKNALRGKKLTFVNVEKILKDLGYTIVLFNTPFGDEEIKRYHLEYEKKTLKAFTYSQTAHIVFINAALHSDDRLYLALHELGHIALGHIGDGKLATRNSILIDIEADHFAYSIINKSVNTSFYVLIVLFIMCVAILLNTGKVKTATNSLTPNENVEQSQTADVVYVTSSGNKFHRQDCIYTKDKKLTELQYSEALEHYAPCKVCKP